MRFAKGCKVEKVVSKDRVRPALCDPWVGTIDGVKVLVATDSYRLAYWPIELEDGEEAPADGTYLPVELVQREVKAAYASVTVSEDGKSATLTEYGEGSATRPILEAQPPNFVALFPDQGVAPFTIGLNAKLLYELAQGLGSELVALTFTNSPDGAPNALRPMTVRPMPHGKLSASDLEGRRGLLMPIRVSGEAAAPKS